jgi:hypothetical protein
MEFDAQRQKTEALTKKINSISKVFDQAEDVCSEDIQEFVQEKTKDVVLHKEDYHPIDVVTLEIMAQDFQHSREVLEETIDNGRRVLSVATLTLMDADEESKAGDTMAFAELTTAVLNGIKVQSQLYKDFSSVLLNLKKLKEGEGPGKVTNNVTINTNETISTVDLIAQLKDVK